MKTHLRNLSLLWLRWTLGIVVLLESIHFTFSAGTVNLLIYTSAVWACVVAGATKEFAGE
jgi:hypothetical protein